ncbi:MAG: zinc-dependent metalloprotease [Bacteroidia bacterium]|nr:zinc-dependent metalloprotease [Bacteroidia bacterium]
MKKITQSFLALALAALTSSVANAQNNRKIFCGDEILKNNLETRFPGFKEATKQTFNQTQQLAKQSNRIGGAYSVNVVVHVVYKNPDENLPDSVIQSQMDVLNEDYNRLNPDTANLRTFFKPIAGSANIHFNLAQVKRVATTKEFTISLTSSAMPNQMKWDSLGGSTAVDPDHYLNIWVVKIQPIMFGGMQLGQVLGFAFPPAGLSNWPANSQAAVKGEDGVVRDFRCFGRNNPNPISMDNGATNVVIRGRTPSHEVGHYLGLRHIWGDGGGFGGGGNNCTGNDGIADTPKANNQSNFDCDTTKNTCVDTLTWTTVDAPDLVENFMDYASESCMNMLTLGQIAHMRATLEGPRNGLIDPSGIKPISLEKTISVYPNPANDFITISSVNNTISKIELFTVTGQKINTYSSLRPMLSYTISTQDLKEGSYFIKITSETKTISKKIIIIK